MKLGHPHEPVISEAAFQRAVIEFAGLNGWLTNHFSDSRRQVTRRGVTRYVGDAGAAGFPDLTLVRERLIMAELKAENGRLTPKQRLWLQRLETAGVEVYVWRPSAWEDIERILGGGA